MLIPVMKKNYQLGLLYFTKLLIDADGVVNDQEIAALRTIKEKENISDELYAEFEESLHDLKERTIYEKGISLVNNCTREEKLKVFSTLYCLSEVDGRVHVKEIKLLLYSIKSAELEFDEVVGYAKRNRMFTS